MVNGEIDQVVAQFKSLLRIGHEASLKLECKIGEVLISLNCKVGWNEPPMSATLTNFDVSRKYRSPSYYRRQVRRRSERESRSLDNVLLPVCVAEHVKEETRDESCKNVAAVEAGNLDVADNVISKAEEGIVDEETAVVDNHTKADEPPCNMKSQKISFTCNSDVRNYPPLFDSESRTFLANGEDRVMELSRYDENRSAIENLRSLTSSLEAMGNLNVR